jgi:uncharacterized protein (TIGR02145 family)
VTIKLKFRPYLFIFTGLSLLIIAGCKKDETRIDPVITWENPEDIWFGTLLSEIQLNATANIPGTFVYTPAMRTKLNEGSNQDLKVDFTPSDSTAYNKATKTVKINVTALPILSDIDGNVYKTLVIGTQVWMAENLKTTRYNNGTAIPYIANSTAWAALTSGAYCNYNYLPVNSKAYGNLYNHYAVADEQKLCPTGWHVPSDVEWTVMEDYLIMNGYNFDGTTEGNKYAKALASATGWTSNSGIGTVGNVDYPDKRNITGFTALPGGYCRSNGTFPYDKFYGFWWSSSESSASNGWSRYIRCFESHVNREGRNKNQGLSIRCIKDY